MANHVGKVYPDRRPKTGFWQLNDDSILRSLALSAINQVNVFAERTNVDIRRTRTVRNQNPTVERSIRSADAAGSFIEVDSTAGVAPSTGPV